MNDIPFDWKTGENDIERCIIPISQDDVGILKVYLNNDNNYNSYNGSIEYLHCGKTIFSISKDNWVSKDFLKRTLEDLFKKVNNSKIVSFK